jgi:hypothetical protein
MRQWKIAISLAVIGAVAAPFAFGTYEAEPTSQTWIPITEEIREKVVANLKSNNDCQGLVNPALGSCRFEQKAVKEGGVYGEEPSTPLYLVLNAAAAIAGFVLTFGLTFLLPALVRRYWRWLNT